MALYLNKLETTSSKDVLYQVCMKLAKWFKKRSLKCEKVTDRNDNKPLSFQLRRAKNPSETCKFVSMVGSTYLNSRLWIHSFALLHIFSCHCRYCSIWQVGNIHESLLVIGHHVIGHHGIHSCHLVHPLMVGVYLTPRDYWGLGQSLGLWTPGWSDRGSPWRWELHMTHRKIGLERVHIFLHLWKWDSTLELSIHIFLLPYDKFNIL